MQVAIWTQGYADAVILSKLAPPSAVGWYGAARNVMNAAITPAAILAAASFPRLARAATDPEQFKREIRVGVRPLLGLGALGSVGIYLFADTAVHVIYDKNEFGPAAVILQLFAFGLPLLFLDVFFGYAATALGKQGLLSIAKFFVVLLTAGLAILLVPLCQARFGNGGLGLVLAFVCGEVVMVATAMALIPRGMLGRELWLDSGRAISAGAGTLLLLRALPSVSPVVGIPACVLVFVVLSVAVGLVRQADLALWAAAMGRPDGGTGVQ
jgi:O-antigen/teichoic acid export membrane protein